MKKTEVLTGIKSFDKAYLEVAKPGLSLILENGDTLEKEIKTAKYQIDGLQHTFEHLKAFDPEFSVVDSKTTERLDGQKFNVNIQSGDHGEYCPSASLSDIEDHLSNLKPDETMTIRLIKE